MNPNEEDQAQMQRLREKYSKDASGRADQGAAYEVINSEGQHTTVKLDGGVEAKMCPICNGMGIVSEEYNHRVMQKMCLQCNGEGVKVLKNGVEVKAAEGANRSDDLMVARKQSLEVELAKIQGKIKSLQEESAAITSGLLNDSDQEGRKLMEALVCQLTMQIDRLEKIQTSSQAKLNNLGKP